MQSKFVLHCDVLYEVIGEKSGSCNLVHVSQLGDIRTEAYPGWIDKQFLSPTMSSAQARDWLFYTANDL